MSSNPEHVLALARRAWEKGLPSDEEVDAGAERVARRMRRTSTPAPRFRRPVAALAFAVVFGGALAYAATGGVHWLGGSEGSKSAPAVSAPMHSAVRAGLGQYRGVWQSALSQDFAKPTHADDSNDDATSDTTDRQKSEEATRAAAPTLDGKPSGAVPQPSAPVASNAKSAASLSSSWSQVDQALDAHDDARATQALEGLAKSNDATTRAKAALGLAQLARSKGDCKKARSLALGVVNSPNVDAAVAKHAQEIVLLCD